MASPIVLGAAFGGGYWLWSKYQQSKKVAATPSQSVADTGADPDPVGAGPITGTSPLGKVRIAAVGQAGASGSGAVAGARGASAAPGDPTGGQPVGTAPVAPAGGGGGGSGLGAVEEDRRINRLIKSGTAYRLVL